IALNYVSVTAFTRDAAGRVNGVEVHDALGDRPLTVQSACVFNAAGPWVDAVRRLDDTQARNRLRPTKGVHILTEAFVSKHAVVMRSASPAEKKPRVLFVIPYGGRTLIGTTDTDHHGPADDARYLDEDVHASPEEVRYLLDAVNQTFDVKLTEKDVISSYAGWRPLVAPPEAGVSESSISREYEIFASDSGLFSIAGGKLTAFRSMAMHAVADVVDSLGRTDLKPSAIEGHPLSGSELEGKTLQAYLQTARQHAPFAADLVETLVSRYGSNWPDLRRLLEADASLGERIPGLSADQPHWFVEVVYALEHEGALTVSDFLMRRTRLHLLDQNQALDAAEPVAARMAAWLGPRQGWDEAACDRWKRHQIASYEAEVARDRAARSGAARQA
ncbi:MAG TPA: FAD-dependent oxidoreductase, partial [Oscillatoriaceae cyanobacterium]